MSLPAKVSPVPVITQLRVIVFALSLFLLIAPINCSYPFVGHCIPRSVVRNLNLTKYSGIWYEIEKYYSYADSGLSCTTVKYYKPKLTKDGDQIVEFFKKSVSGGNTYRRISSKPGKLVHPHPRPHKSNGVTDSHLNSNSTFTPKISTTPENGRLEAIFHQRNRNFGTKSKESKLPKSKSKSQSEEIGVREAYWVLGTDYANYSVVWSCQNAGIMNFQNVVFLSRVREPSMHVRGWAYGVMKSQALSIKLLFSTGQTQCPDLFHNSNKKRNKNV